MKTIVLQGIQWKAKLAVHLMQRNLCNTMAKVWILAMRVWI